MALAKNEEGWTAMPTQYNAVQWSKAFVFAFANAVAALLILASLRAADEKLAPKRKIQIAGLSFHKRYSF
jgi:hypothetical protein